MDSVCGIRPDPIGVQNNNMEYPHQKSGSVQHLTLSADEFQVHCNSFGTPASYNSNHNNRLNNRNLVDGYRRSIGNHRSDSFEKASPNRGRISDFIRQSSREDKIQSQHGGQDSYSSGYSGMSESHSSGSPYNRDQDGEDDNQSVCSGYLNDYSEVGSCIRRVIRQKVMPIVAPVDVENSTDNETSFSSFTQSTLLAGDDFIFLEKCSKLPDICRNLAWTENDVLMVLREGRTKHMSGHVTVEMMQKISYLLQRPLLRIAREAKRLSLRINMCTKHEIETAFKTVLPRSLALSCQQACAKALTLYTMSGDSLKQSKSSRCGLKFSVGKFHRWMVMSHVGMRVHEFSAVYLAACMENLLEEIVLRALGKENLGENVWNLDILEYGVSSNAELWGLLQQYEHLICGRNAFAVVSLPTDYDKNAKANERQYEQETLEQCMLATCVGSLSELGYLVYEVMHGWYLDAKYRVCQKSQKSQPVYWSPDALHTLYTYMKCQDMVYGDGLKGRKTIKLTSERQYNLVPPLYEWVRCIVSFTEHRGCCMVTPRDVQEGARVLVPGNNCPPHRPEYLEQPTQLSKKKSSPVEVQAAMQRTMVQNLLFGGHYEMFGEMMESLGATGKEILNSPDDKGLTMLMQASIQGNEDALLTLLNSGAEINILVPKDTAKYPSIHPLTRLWSALHFAVSFNHLSVVQRLLDRGARVEGYLRDGEENVTVTPLQLACAGGVIDLVNLLLAAGADPYLHTTPKNGVSFTYNRGGLSAFSMAAMHGHRDIVKCLLRHPVLTESDNLLSLEEILQEGVSQKGSKSSERGVQYHLHSRIKNYHIYEEIPGESIYQTIDDTFSQRSSTHPFRQRLTHSFNHTSRSVGKPNTSITTNNSPSGKNNNKVISSQSFTSFSTSGKNGSSKVSSADGFIGKLSKIQLRVLQDALYNAAENGFLETVMEFRVAGLDWTLHAWSRCLEYSFEEGKVKSLDNLLGQFKASFTQDDVTAEFLHDTVPLMFDMLKLNKDGDIKLKLSEALSFIYGKEPLPKLRNFKLEEPKHFTQIDPRYLNNSEHSDVHFLIDGKTFYAHKVALVQSSQRFRAMLTNAFPEEKIPVIELHDVRYKIFKYMMQFLYQGPQDLSVESKDIIELLGSAHFFMLEGLQRFCESLCAKKINMENCVTIYKNAKLYNSAELITYCEGYFLQNLSTLLTKNDSFHKMVYSSKRQTYNLSGGVMATLTEKLAAKLENKKKLAPGIRL